MLNAQLFFLSVEATGVYNAVFRIRWFNASPDAFERRILSINDEMPAPVIIVNRGDLINITVINELNESTSIHWHGLIQRRSVAMDGVPGVTQCEILPNQSFVYRFSTGNQSGTFWYHSHSAMQYGDGLKGLVIIRDPQDPWKSFYEGEELLEFTDWYHQPVHVLLQSYLSPGMMDPTPDTGLINGIGQFNCSGTRTCSYHHASIVRGTSKRFRLINTGVYARITVTIDEHQMRLIEADGTSLDGQSSVRTLRLGPGQRYSVLVTADKASVSSNFWIRATIHPFVDYNNRYDTSSQPNVSAILHYVNDLNENVKGRVPSMESFFNDQDRIDRSIRDGELFSDESNLIPMSEANSGVPTEGTIVRLIFNSKHQGSNPGFFYFNNQTFVHPTNQTLLAAVVLDQRKQLDWPTLVQIEEGQIVDLLINNIDFAPHPFHLHGHHGWLLAEGKAKAGYFNQSTFESIKLNTINPIYRDTFTVNPFSYVLLRFRADNPGIWMMHCHNDWHLNLGMAMIFLESPTKIQQFYTNLNLTRSLTRQCQSHH